MSCHPQTGAPPTLPIFHNMKKHLLLLCAALLLASLPAFSQNRSHRPKVAVVLSGGGAKGAAHVGVLKVIERAGIPVDIITGTSMGSIVGGLYAVGYDAATLDSIVRNQDWALLLSDRDDVRKQSISAREKENTYFMTKDFSLSNQNRSSNAGIVHGKNIMMLFNKLVGQYADSCDFNSLPIPFACVATNILDNTEHDFHSGRLPVAMRASMAIPAVFSPVRLGDEVLVDGGLRNNYPADVARAMGADYIIGVTVQGDQKTADELNSTTDILGQIVTVNCRNKYQENLKITDIAIRVNPQGYSTASFNANAIDTLIIRGEEEAMKHWDELVALRQKLGLPNNYQAPRLTPPTIREDTTAHTSMVPILYADTDTAYSKKETVARTGLGVRFDTEERVAMQTKIAVTMPTNFPSELAATLRLGKRIMARLDYTARVKPNTKNAVAMRSVSNIYYAFRHDDVNFYNRGDKDWGLTYDRHTASLSLLNFNIRNFSLDLGLQFDYYHPIDLLTEENSPYGSTLHDEHFFTYRIRADYNGENDWYFPTEGARFAAAYAYHTDNMAKLNGKSGLSDVSGFWRISMSPNSRLTLRPSVFGRMLFGQEPHFFLSNFVGGAWEGHYMEQQMPFAGTGHIERAQRHFIGASFTAQQRISTKNYIRLTGSIAQQSPKLSEIFKHHTRLGIEGGYYYKTFIGPIGGTLGYSNFTKELYLFLNIGMVF